MNRVLAFKRSRAGWIMLDVITGLIILLVLMVTFSAAILRQQRGKQKLADTRAAIRLAEQTATALQLGQAPPAPPEGETIEIASIVPPSESAPPAGRSWVRIRVTSNGRTATLVALTRSAAAATTRTTTTTTQPGGT